MEHKTEFMAFDTRRKELLKSVFQMDWSTTDISRIRGKSTRESTEIPSTVAGDELILLPYVNIDADSGEGIYLGSIVVKDLFTRQEIGVIIYQPPEYKLCLARFFTGQLLIPPGEMKNQMGYRSIHRYPPSHKLYILGHILAPEIEHNLLAGWGFLPDQIIWKNRGGYVCRKRGDIYPDGKD